MTAGSFVNTSTRVRRVIYTRKTQMHAGKVWHGRRWATALSMPHYWRATSSQHARLRNSGRLGRRATEKVTAALAQIEHQVSSFREQPDDIGLIAIGCALGYLDFRFAELNWRASHPLTAAWFALFDAHPAMTATHPHV
jgi:hypothetical protein